MPAQFIDFGHVHAKLSPDRNWIQFFTPHDFEDGRVIPAQNLDIHGPEKLRALADALAPWRSPEDAESLSRRVLVTSLLDAAQRAWGEAESSEMGRCEVPEALIDALGEAARALRVGVSGEDDAP